MDYLKYYKLEKEKHYYNAYKKFYGLLAENRNPERYIRRYMTGLKDEMESLYQGPVDNITSKNLFKYELIIEFLDCLEFVPEKIMEKFEQRFIIKKQEHLKEIDMGRKAP